MTESYPQRLAAAMREILSILVTSAGSIRRDGRNRDADRPIDRLSN
jgi:hypothetical protein